MFDHVETILGSSIGNPILEAIRAKPGFSGWLDSFAVDIAMTDLVNTAIRSNVNIFSIDYSSFDTSVAPHFYNYMYEILDHWFKPESRDFIKLLLDSMATVNLVCPDGIWTGRYGGMPSGSALTNLVDTLINLLAGFYCAERLGSELLRYEVLGDDAVFVFSESPEADDVAKIMGELGLSVNPSKQWISPSSAHYLQRWHSKEYLVDGVCRGVRSPYRAINSMMSYERFRQGWNKYMDSARWIMQTENVRWDPRFDQFVEFVKEGDKVLSSGADPVSIFARAGGASKIREVLSITSFPYNVQEPEGVDGFATTVVLRNLM
jgi:hypothetical protein